MNANLVIRSEEVSEYTPHHFSAFASDLGMSGFPSSLKTTLGNGRDFILSGKQVSEGDLQSVTYRQANGCVCLTIYND